MAYNTNRKNALRAKLTELYTITLNAISIQKVLSTKILLINKNLYAQELLKDFKTWRERLESQIERRTIGRHRELGEESAEGRKENAGLQGKTAADKPIELGAVADG